jgi:pyruvate ferredoxin oxidoreductase alpha subunit
MDHALDVIQGVYDRFAAVTGRQYSHLMTYRMEDADIAMVVANSAAGNARIVADQLRAEGVKAGVIKLRTFRPFPSAEYAKALAGVKAVGVMDRADSYGGVGGPLYMEILSALYQYDVRVKTANFIYGLGGRDIFPQDVENGFRLLQKAAEGADLPKSRVYLNMKGA